MERQITAHLTDEQFTDLLLGTSPSAVQAHLKSCAQCAEEAERVSGAIGSFAEHSRVWAERRAAARPALAPTHVPVFEWLHRPQAWTAAALAIALAVSVGVSAHNHHASTAQTQIAKVQPAAAVSSATLKADNDLLSAIDGELRADESTSVIAYGLTNSAHAGRTRPAKRMINE